VRPPPPPHVVDPGRGAGLASNWAPWSVHLLRAKPFLDMSAVARYTQQLAGLPRVRPDSAHPHAHSRPLSLRPPARMTPLRLWPAASRTPTRCTSCAAAACWRRCASRARGSPASGRSRTLWSTSGRWRRSCTTGQSWTTGAACICVRVCACVPGCVYMCVCVCANACVCMIVGA
jgi:hypothetical protein